MAQATKTASSALRTSDDPIESFTTWLQLNSKPLLMGVGAVAVTVAAIMVYRSTAASTRAKASLALSEAQVPFAEGKTADAKKALEKVIARYGTTGAGQQAAVLLAQVQFEEKQYDAGIKGLEKARGAASADFKAGIDAMIASGYELKGDFAKAAEAYGKAAAASAFDAERRGYEASQARSLMSAGKTADAKKIWEKLATYEGETVGQEAAVRLGELAGKS
jgi:predicted negative regulator of RcsB-dependent stress response